ncbi:MAG: S-layer homology domain-containing protein [Oscillospiraceae bacterium]|nr:S-layer homology domain-containing protein [Oscillospiraceae bacterium]
MRKKRLVSLLLCFCLTFALLPTMARAEESDVSYDFSNYDFSDFDEEDYEKLGRELLDAAGYDSSKYTSEFYDWEGIVHRLMLELDDKLAAEEEAKSEAAYRAQQMELKEAAKKDVYTQAEADARWWKLNEEELILDGVTGDNETFLDLDVEQRSTITRLLLDYPGADPCDLTGVWWQYYEDCYHNLKEVWLSPKVDAKAFLDGLKEDEADGGGIAYSSGIMNGMLTIFVPDSQLPKGLLSYSATPTNPYYSVKVYSGDVYNAYEQGPSAARDWCPGHEYTGKIQTASRMYQNITCQRPNLWYYSCKWCGQCEYNPNHTFSQEIGGSKDTSKERANHQWELYDLSEKNYIGTNERGEKVYSPSCIWCGLSQREDDLNYTYEQYLRDMSEKDSAENRASYQYYKDVTKKQWAVGGSTYNAAMKASVDSYRLPFAFAVAGGKEVNATVSSWAQDGVNWAAQNDLIDKSLLGSDYTGAITRLQFCSVAVKMAEKMLDKTITPAPSGTFTDTDNEYVRKAYAAGITSGVGEGRFDPDGTLTRQQMATFLYRALQYVKNNSDIRYTIYDSKLDDYSDKGQIADWATEPMAFMNALGLVNGTSDTTLAPNNNCTIEQALIVANRSLRADLIGWYQSLASTDKNVTDSGMGGNVTKRCFYAIPADVQADGRFNQLRYRNSERFWVTGAAQTESWLTRARQAQGDYIRFLKMIDPYTGDTLYIENCNFRPVKAD